MTETTPRHKILVPVDFSDHSMAALRRATFLARVMDCDLALLHVVDTTSIVPVQQGPQGVLELGHLTSRLRDAAREKLRGVAREADPDGRVIKIVDVVEGRPWQVILHLASSVLPQLIVMGKRGHAPAGSGMGSVAERVVRNARCDVLVVRESEAPLPKAVGEE